MSIVAYLFWCIGAFAFYMLWLLDIKAFVEVIVPWLVFMLVVFAPLIWTLRREDRRGP